MNSLNTLQIVSTRFPAFLLLLVTCIAGCGGPVAVPVEGRVTLDDKPFENVKVLFYVEGGGPETNFTGITDADGHFTLASLDGKQSGVAPGDYLVNLTTNHWAPDALETDPPPKERVAPGQREHEYKVSDEGTTEANFALTRK